MDRTNLLAGLKAAGLDPEVEGGLVLLGRQGDAEAMRRLIASQLRAVVAIARRYRSSGVPMADLVQEGVIGVIQAVRRFNPERGVRLSTYATWWIRAAIQDYVVRSASMVRIGTTNTQKALFLRLRRMAEDLRAGAESVSDGLATKLAQSFNTTIADVMTLARRVGGDRSLDQPLADADGHSVTLGDLLPAQTPSPEAAVSERLDRRLWRDALAGALRALPPRERLIIQRRYIEEARHTFEAIGREIGVSKDRVRQLEARALARLRLVLAPLHAAL